MKTSKVRLSQCMIVKNEERNMEQALSWGKGIVWEQIVVDTGSTDGTVELAKKMGAKVFHFTWNNDFSAAKNYALSRAKGNWIAFLDADEWFPKEDGSKILNLLQQLHPAGNIHVLRTRLANVDQKGTIMDVFCQDRIFRNDPNLRYRYRIHEELYLKQGSIGLCDGQNELMILHSGYESPELRPEKGRRNVPLLKQDLEEHPRDAMRWLYLGDCYEIMGEGKEALDCYRKVLNDPQMEITRSLAPIHAGLEIMKLRSNDPPEEMEEEYLQIRQKLKGIGGDLHPDLDYYLGGWKLRSGEVKEAAGLFESALAKMDAYKGEDVIRMASNLEMVHRMIATAALMEGNPQKAVSFAVSALKVNKYSADGIQLLLRAFLTEYKEGMPAEPYWQFLCKVYDRQNLKDLLFLHKFAEEAGFSALQKRIQEELPEPVREQIANKR